MTISPARKIAFETLRRVHSEGGYASDVLHAVLGPHTSSAIRHDDASLATELTLGVLRWQRLLDFLLERQIKKSVAKLDLAVLLALRLGLYQLRFLDRIPGRAAVHESVELVKLAKKFSASGFVNAVLRRLAPNAKASIETSLPAEMSPIERLSILHSHPIWLVERYLARFGPGETEKLLAANNRAPRLSCILHRKDERDAVFAEIAQAGLQVLPPSFLRNAFAVSGGSITRSAAFHRGAISIQDEASQAIPLLLNVQPGDSVLDLCAAPGGKTAGFARAADLAEQKSRPADGPNSGIVIAADLHTHRVFAMRQQFHRLGLEHVELIALDATQPLPFTRLFDKILVDAPCSGTGTLARHPEIRWRLQPPHLAEIHHLQVQILTQALAQLAPGGLLLYSTCSLEPEENDSVVEEVLRRHPHISPASKTRSAQMLAPHLLSKIAPENFFDPFGYFRTVPGTSPADGFFAALLEKT